MHYYIDGYNLLFRILKAGDDLKHQREQITLDLAAKADLLGINATLVFDSHYQEGESTRSHFKNLEIVFTSLGDTADDYILQELKESPNPSEHTVVTSDKKLAYLCRLRLGKTESVDEFLGWFNKRYKNKLRQRKEGVKPLAPPPPKAPPAPPIAPIPEGSLDYYLNTFETELSLIEKEQEKAPKPKKKEKESKKIKPKKPLTPEEAHLSDMERWLRAFEAE